MVLHEYSQSNREILLVFDWMRKKKGIIIIATDDINVSWTISYVLASKNYVEVV